MDKNKTIDQVRSSVLRKVSTLKPGSQQQVDEDDINSLIASQDGFIRLFVNQYADSHDGKHDIGAITTALMETLKWRKSVNVSKIKAADFPLEMWTRNPTFAHQDEDHVIVMYQMRDESKISQTWSELTFKFMLCNYETSMRAVLTGKKSILLCDTSHLSLSRIDVSMQSQLMKLLDKHFPSIVSCMCIYGLPKFLTPMANFFTKLVLPSSLRKTFLVMSRDAVSSHVPDQILPVEFGGTVKLKDVLEFYQLAPASIKDAADKWGLDQTEVTKILKSCSMTAAAGGD
jgi:hypothetical protein